MKQPRFKQLIFPFIFLSLQLCMTSVLADGKIQLNSITVEAVDDGYTISIDSDLELNATLEQALNKGIVLYFVAKFTLVDPRWYWFDKEVARTKPRIGLRYYALTRQYRLIGNTFTYNFSTLNEALRQLQNTEFKNLSLRIREELNPETYYDAELRVWLDLTRLPKPFQVEALGSNAWNLSSEKITWRMKIPPAGQPYHLLANP